MSFVHLATLTGLLGLAFPLAAHFFGQARAARHSFAAGRFLQNTAAPAKGHRRLSDLPLLLLRSLLLAAFVLAAAGPVWRPAGQASAQREERLALVVDAGPSMAYVPGGAAGGGTALWQQARNDALAVLAAAPAGTVATLQILGHEALAVPATADLDRLVAALGRLAGPAASPAKLPQLASDAVAELGPPAPPAEDVLWLFSDFARHAWTSPSPSPPGRPAGALVHVRLMDAARRTGGEPLADESLPPLPNVAVQDVAVVAAAGPDASTPQRRVRIRLHNFGARATGPRTLQLHLDGELVQQAVVQLEAGATVEKWLAWPDRAEARQGRRLLVARLAPSAEDGLAADDQFGRYIEAHAAAKVLAVGGPGQGPRPASPAAADLGGDGVGAAPGSTDLADPSYGDPLYFFERALGHPVEDDGGWVLTTCPAGTLAVRLAQAEKAGEPFDTVVLADATGLGEGEGDAEALATHVARGGGVLVALGEASAAAAEGQATPPWLPCPLREVADAVLAQGAPAHLGPVSFDHEVLRGLDPALATSLGAAQVRRFVHVDGRHLAPWQQVLALEQGAPLVVVAGGGAGGGGRRLLWTTSLDLTWTDLPLRTAFVPLVQRLVRYSAGITVPAGPGAAVAGEQVRYLAPREVERVALAAIGEGGPRPSADLERQAAVDGVGAAVLTAPDQPGSYQLHGRRRGTWQPLDGSAVVVNAHPEASDYATVAPAALRRRLRDTWQSPAAGRALDAGPQAGRDRNYAEALLLAAFFLALLESVVASPASPKKASQVGVVPRLFSRFLRLRPALRVLKRTRVV